VNLLGAAAAINHPHAIFLFGNYKIDILKHVVVFFASYISENR
jgi:hypothetical protein